MEEDIEKEIERVLERQVALTQHLESLFLEAALARVDAVSLFIIAAALSRVNGVIAY